MSDFEAKKREAFTPIFFESGAALLDCQNLEFSIAFMLFNLSRLGIVGLNPRDIQSIMDDKDKKTAGQLIQMMKKHVKVSEGIETALIEALPARNYLIHRILSENIEDFIDEEKRNLLVKRIRSLRSKVRKVDNLLRPFNEGLSHALDGVDPQDIKEEVKKIFS